MTFERPFALAHYLRQVSVEVALVHEGRMLTARWCPGIVATDNVIANAEDIEAVSAIQID